MTTDINRDIVLEQLKGLVEADGRWVVESFIWGSSKAKGSRKRDPDAPKREVKPDSYFHLNNGVVWPLLKAYIEAHKDELGEDRCKELKGVKARTQISSAIWEGIKGLDSEARIEAMESINEARVLAALEAWTASPPETRYKGGGGGSGASAASDGSKKSKSSSGSKKLAEMSEEERKAFYKARAAKAAATKAAKKAEAAGGGAGAAAAPAAAAAGGEPAAADDEEVEMEDEDAPSVAPQPIELDFGKGKQTFGYVDHAGTRYIFKTSGELLGALNPATGKLRKVKAEENPFA